MTENTRNRLEAVKEMETLEITFGPFIPSEIKQCDIPTYFRRFHFWSTKVDVHEHKELIHKFVNTFGEDIRII